LILINKEGHPMDGAKGNSGYEVLSPWAESDPVPFRGISPRLTDLTNKTIGLFANHKRAASRIRTVLEKKLKERFPTVKTSLFPLEYKGAVSQSEHKAKFKEWLNGVDTVVAAVGD
jgi:hypothetical protein